MDQFKGRTAFITGGANGIGFAMAKVFQREGMNVVIADIRHDHLDRALEVLKADSKPAHGIRLDVSSREEMARAADECEEVFGNVHLVCNNAGINLFKPIDECSYEDWDWVMGVNLNGVINGIQTFIPRMKAHGEGGHIVNTASMASFIAGPGAGIYTAAKFAVRGMSDALRYSLPRHGIGVSVLCPGLVDSHIFASNDVRPTALPTAKDPNEAEFTERLKAVQARGMDPMEVAEKVLKGVRNDDFYILSHPEFKEELKELFDEVLAAVPDEEPDPERLAFEDHRRAMKKQALANKGHTVL